jgi:hypothetical protein
MMMAGPLAIQLRLTTDTISKNINLNFTLSRIMVGTSAFLSQSKLCYTLASHCRTCDEEFAAVAVDCCHNF